MQISPKVRAVLTGVASAVSLFGTLLAAGTIANLPVWVGAVVAVLGTVFAALGIVPTGVGGVQVGVLNPSVEGATTPPVREVPR